MKKLYLILLLGIGMFSQQSWAPPIKGEATGGGAAAPDISKCDLNPSKQTKLKVKGEDGKIHFVCTGPITCEGKAAPIYCKVSEKEACPNKTDRCSYLGSEPVKFLKTQTTTNIILNFTFHDGTKLTNNNRYQCLVEIFLNERIPDSRNYLIKCLMDYRGPWGSGSSGIEANFIFLQNNPQLGTKGFSVDLKMSIIGPDRNIDYWTLSSNVGRSTGGIDIYELKDDKNGKLVLKFRTIENWIPKIDTPDFRKYKINSGGEGIVEIQ